MLVLNHPLARSPSQSADRRSMAIATRLPSNIYCKKLLSTAGSYVNRRMSETR